jgi:CRP/FNR family nitrogen fixation transcriptional regulator
METRLSNGRGDSISLPVSRYDIADYLAVSVETVSRSLTDLKHRGVIKLSGTRTVSIVDRDLLEEGEHDECAGRLKARPHGTTTPARAAAA